MIDEPEGRNNREPRREQTRPALTTFQELFRQVQGLQQNPQQANDDMATGVLFGRNSGQTTLTRAQENEQPLLRAA